MDSLRDDGITERELEVAKGHLRADLMLSLEDSGARMARIGASLLLHDRVLTVDDLLGIWGEPTRTGKPVGSDLVQHKKTLPVSIAIARAGDRLSELLHLLEGDLTPADMERARTLIEECGAREATASLADEHLDLAVTALDRVSLVPGPKSDLVAIARFVTERDR